ncbi:MAG TPA: shikimate kinase [Acidobacteriaceae bacterium]|jgi:shikimate kinase|nr:shikimate kinase [Acidobacteriaceae bacterium]
MKHPKAPIADPFPEPRDRIERLVLTGFMGSGKTTVGRLLAAQLGWRFVDLDEEIESFAGRTVAEIFAEDREDAFRRLETTALQSMLHGVALVVALGGGAVLSASNRKLLAMSSGTLTVFLRASSSTLYARCLRQSADPQAAIRPLMGNSEAFAERLARREDLYREVADLLIDTSNQTPEESAESVFRAVRSTL